MINTCTNCNSTNDITIIKTIEEPKYKEIHVILKCEKCKNFFVNIYTYTDTYQVNEEWVSKMIKI